MTTPWKPADRSAVSAFILVTDAEKTVAFAKDVFGATELSPPLRFSDGKIWNAELDISGSTVMVSEATAPDMHRPGFLYVMTPDVDAAFARAVAHGAQIAQPVDDQFYGDRAGGVVDACGNLWWIATFKEDVPPEELARRAREVEARRRGGGTA